MRQLRRLDQIAKHHGELAPLSFRRRRLRITPGRARQWHRRFAGAYAGDGAEQPLTMAEHCDPTSFGSLKKDIIMATSDPYVVIAELTLFQNVSNADAKELPWCRMRPRLF